VPERQRQNGMVRRRHVLPPARTRRQRNARRQKADQPAGSRTHRPLLLLDPRRSACPAEPPPMARPPRRHSAKSPSRSLRAFVCNQSKGRDCSKSFSKVKRSFCRGSTSSSLLEGKGETSHDPQTWHSLCYRWEKAGRLRFFFPFRLLW